MWSPPWPRGSCGGGNNDNRIVAVGRCATMVMACWGIGLGHDNHGGGGKYFGHGHRKIVIEVEMVVVRWWWWK